MTFSRRTTGATLMLAVLVAGCAGTSEPTEPSNAPAAATTTGPAPTSAPSPTADPTPTPEPLPSAQPVSLLWEAHGPVSDMTSTASIAVNPADDTVWVGVPFENLFWIFSQDGEYLESWGESGTGPGQFDFSDHQPNPDGFSPIAFAPDGSFYVGDTGNHRVQHFDADRTYVGEWGSFGSADGRFVQIVWIATDGTTVYVGDGDRYDIQAFEADGSYLRTIEGGFASVGVDGLGNLHASYPQANPVTGDPQAMAIFDADGNELSRINIGVNPEDREVPSLAVDAAGNTYLATIIAGYPWTPMGVLQLGPDGQVVRVIDGGGEFVGVSPAGDTLYTAKGMQLDSSQWTFIRAYSLAGS